MSEIQLWRAIRLTVSAALGSRLKLRNEATGQKLRGWNVSAVFTGLKTLIYVYFMSTYVQTLYAGLIGFTELTCDIKAKINKQKTSFSFHLQNVHSLGPSNKSFVFFYALKLVCWFLLNYSMCALDVISFGYSVHLK